MSLSWLTQAKELFSQLPILTGTAARCGDFVYNLTGGTRSINELPTVLRTIAPEGLRTAIDSLSPYMTQTTLSDAACAIETKTGIPAPATCALVSAGLYTGYKCLQFGYQRFNVQNPVDLIQGILAKNITAIMNVDYAALAKTFDAVLDLKVNHMLDDLQSKIGSTYKMTPKQEKDYKEEVKKQMRDALPEQLNTHKAAVNAAIHQSQVPAASSSTPKTAAPGVQEATFSAAAGFDLTSALARILFNNIEATLGVNATQTNRNRI